ncbi:nitrate- and nitrite sensing domain-containing protein [Nocardia sp. NPDC058705]|uniref:sensor histidine kinase n=1 Tax=Nocardia sp. NPDC058705 TaxID=3346609 RepID=UPI00368A6994
MFLARLGVRTRILAIALIPSVTLVVIGVGAAGYLVNESDKAKSWANELEAAIAPGQELVAAMQSERALTLSLLAGDKSVATALPAARSRVDAAFDVVNATMARAAEVNGTKLGDSEAEAAAYKTAQTTVRGAADAGLLPPADAYMFFNQVLDRFIVGTKQAGLESPNAEVGIGITEGGRLLNIIESMSRSNALGSALVTSEGTFAIPIDEYINQTGYFQTAFPAIGRELVESEANQINAMLAMPQWQQITTMNSAIIARYGAPAAAKPSSSTSSTQVRVDPLPMSPEEWEAAVGTVNRALVDLYSAHNKNVQTLAKDAARNAEVNAALAGGGVLALSVLVFLIALILANRIIRRLRRLCNQTLLLADEQLPATMRTLREGGEVDTDATAPKLDFGKDEIGQVAMAFEHAAAAAIGAAVDEARTREGVRAVFLNIAHRSQIVVHRQLEILDEAERRQEDPALLETLFRLDHLATRERRNAENLIILGGGRPGRQWRQPVPVMDVVRSAIGETLDYARVRVTKLPEVSVVGTVVADLVHLLAELVDNATAFSPPQSRVEAGGNIVGKGVVVEITDQGMGMSADDLVRYNNMLADPPDFGVGTLSSDSRLGLFVVARLAVAHGVSVRLSESDYGGIRAIVLIPQQLLAGEAELAGVPPAMTGPLRRGLPAPQESAPVAALESSPAPVATLVADPPTPRPMAPAPEMPVVAPPRFDTDTDERPALPRRSRQTNLAPELTEPAAEAPSAPERPRSPEQARDIMSAIENGTRQGRKQQPTSNQDEQEG